MNEVRKRKIPGPDLKASVALEAVRGARTIKEIAEEHGMHPVQVGQYKRVLLERAAELFSGKRGPKKDEVQSELVQLHAQIARLKLECEQLRGALSQARDEHLSVDQ